MQGFFVGAFTKALATLLTYPMQVAQTRLREAPDDPETGRRKTLRSCLMEVLEQHGFGGLFTGLPAKLVQTVANAAFMFAFYETILIYTRKAFRIVGERRKAIVQG